MQLEQEENRVIIGYLDTILFEALLDYSSASDLAVVNVNGQSICFSKGKIKQLKTILLKLRGEI